MKSRHLKRSLSVTARMASADLQAALAVFYGLPFGPRCMTAVLILGRGSRVAVAVVFLVSIGCLLVAMGLAAVLGLWLGGAV